MLEKTTLKKERRLYEKRFYIFFRQVDLLRFNYLSPLYFILATTMLLYNIYIFFLLFFFGSFFFFLSLSKTIKKMCDEYRQRKYDAFCEAQYGNGEEQAAQQAQ